MLEQILLGSGLIVTTILAGAGAYAAMEGALARKRAWLHSEPHGPKLMLVLLIAIFWTLAMMTWNVWLWALTLYALDLFETLEDSVYFTLVAYTTLGFGDVLLGEEWRLLGGLAAANGMIMFGLSTAMLVEATRNVRLGQHEARRRRMEKDAPPGPIS